MQHLLMVMALALATALAPPAPAPAVERVIDAEMSATGVPGLAYAVVTDGEVTASGERGVVRLGSRDEVGPHTAFLTGSVSKSFTALAVMQLVEGGEVGLDTPVETYLEHLVGAPAGAVTIRQLLSHTSGFSTLQGNTSHTDESGGEDELAHRVDALADDAPAHPPGERWEYSNTNYAVLGRVVEVVGGQDYQGYVTDHILRPVGMSDSFVADGGVHPSTATGHRPWFGGKRPLPDQRTSRGTAPQGGIVASATDVARYLAVMMNGRDDVLSAQGKATMMQPAGQVSPFYGFGWFVDPEDDTVWHTGTSPGFEATATMLPSRGSAVVVLVNGGSGVGFGETSPLRDRVTAAALGLDDEERSRVPQQALFIGLVLLPVLYLVCIAWAWRHRGALRAKSGAAGRFSLWFPLFTTSAAAWVMLWLVPTLIGSPITTILLFQPDLGATLVAGAVTGVLWAVVRLAVAHTGRPRTAAG